MTKRKVLILTDSVALPRKPMNWEDTYCFKLKAKFKEIEFIQVSIGGASIIDLRNQLNYYYFLELDTVILQCGIVDAAPRAFSRTELEIIKKLHIYRFTKKLVKPFRKYRAIHYAKPNLFRKLLKEMVNKLDARRFYSIGIIPASQEYENKLPNIKKYIDIYNEILKSESSYIDIKNIPKQAILSDHHHINELGHNYIFENLENIIKR